MPIIEDPGYDSTPSLSRNLVPNYRAAREAPSSLNTLQSLVANFQDKLVGTAFDKTLPLNYAAFKSNDDPTYDPYKNATNDYFAEKPWMLAPFMDGTMDSVHSEAYFNALEMSLEESYRRNERLGVSSWYNTLGTGLVAQGPELIATGVAGKAIGLAKYGEQLAEWAGKGALITKVLKGSAVAGTGNVLYGQATAAIDPTRSTGDEDAIYNDAKMGVLLGGVAVPMIAHGFMKARDRVRTAAGEVVNSLTNERLKQLQVNVANATVQKSYSTATEAAAAHVSDLETLLARGRKAAAESGTATNPPFWWNKQPATNPDFGPVIPPATNPKWSFPETYDGSPKVRGTTKGDGPHTGPAWSFHVPDTGPTWSFNVPDTNPPFWFNDYSASDVVVGPTPEASGVRANTKPPVPAGESKGPSFWFNEYPKTNPDFGPVQPPATNPKWSFAGDVTKPEAATPSPAATVEANANPGRTSPALMTPEEHAQYVASEEGFDPANVIGHTPGGSPIVKSGTKDSRTVFTARRSIKDAIDAREPINAALFDGYQSTSDRPLTLPPGYVLDGDMYVFRGTGGFGLAMPGTNPSWSYAGSAQEPSAFTTAKGSTYAIQPDGTTVRNKAPRPEHPGESGIQPASAKTYYLSPDDANKLSLVQASYPEGVKVAIAERPDGSVGVKYTAGPDAGKFIRDTVVKPQAKPAVGLMPVETFDNGGVHFGNEIVGVSASIAPKGVNFDVRDIMPDQVSPDGRIHVTLLDTPETRRLRAELKAVYGDQIEFHDHAEQDIYDAKLRLETLDDHKAVGQPPEMSWLGKRLQAIYDVASPAARLAKNPDSLLGKLALHTLLDMSGAPREVLDAFGSVARNVPGEGHKMILDGYLGEHYRNVSEAMIESKKAGGFSYRLSTGETVEFTGRAADREAFGRAMWDAAVRENNRQRGDKLYEYDAPEVPAALKKAADSLRKYTEIVGDRGIESGVLSDRVKSAVYLPTVYDVDKIRLNPKDFVDRLHKEARRQRIIDKNPFLNPIEKEVVNFKRSGRKLVADKNGKITDESGNTFREEGLTPEEREKIIAIVEEKKKAIKLENAQLRESARAAGATSTKLSPVSAWDSIKIEDLREHGVSPERYIEEQNLYDLGRAESTLDTLLDPANEHGVADATKRRQIEINHFALRDYLADNALDIIDTYAHRMHGRVGAHLAVKRMADDWAPIVKQYTGKDIVKERYSPSLMIDAVQKHFDEVIANHTTAGDTAGAQKYADAQAKTVALLREHLDKLMGTNIAPTTAGTLAWKWGARQLGRFSTMAFQGTSVVSNLGDLSSLMAMNMMGEGGTKAIGNWIKIFLAGPEHLRRDIENSAAVAMDWTRQMQSIEYGDIPSAIKKRPFGRGPAGTAMAATDKATAGLVSKFYGLNLMRRFTESGRIATVNALYDFVTRGSQALVKADDLIKSGTERAKALDAVGMSEADAEQLARMGFNVQRARKLLDKVDQHGLDYNGNRIDRNHEGQINLEAHKWASEDRELYDALQHAVNGEALNIVLEPKQAYRLLINDRSPGVRLLNNMSSFVTAFGSQWMPLLARRTGAEKAAWIASTLAISAIADALHNHLSGRRTLAESADEWINNPFGMIYGAVNRSPLLGWMSRPIGIAESAGLGPGRFLNNNSLSGVYSRPGQTMLDVSLGPAYQLLSNGLGGVEKTARSLLESGELGDGWKQTWKSIPFNNWIGLRTLNRLSEAADYGTLIGPAPR